MSQHMDVCLQSWANRQHSIHAQPLHNPETWAHVLTQLGACLLHLRLAVRPQDRLGTREQHCFLELRKVYTFGWLRDCQLICRALRRSSRIFTIFWSLGWPPGVAPSPMTLEIPPLRVDVVVCCFLIRRHDCVNVTARDALFTFLLPSEQAIQKVHAPPRVPADRHRAEAAYCISNEHCRQLCVQRCPRVSKANPSSCRCSGLQRVQCHATWIATAHWCQHHISLMVRPLYAPLHEEWLCATMHMFITWN